MPKFAYAAIDATGASVEGVTKADTLGDARARCCSIRTCSRSRSRRSAALFDFELTKEKVKKKELMHFTRQLAVFVKAGIPITEALADHRRRDRGRRAAAHASPTWSTICATAARSRTPRRKHPEAFPDYYVGILQSAELTGKLDETLESLAGYLERELETRVEGGVGAVVPDGRHGDGDVHRGCPRRLRAAAVQAAVRGARRRPAVADADAAVRRHALQRRCGSSRSASSCVIGGT